ncbi:hypothetical protein BDF19DRAFT_452343 [Syncephalis fuscata]|nr:hypothetical protein BDF19DRAFT_452343 [Syncephalis fuscata]
MPIISDTDPAEVEWIKNATTLWGIPLHPLGELDLYDFYTQTIRESPEKHHSMAGGKLQVIFTIIVLSIHVRNFIVSSKMIASSPHSLAPWCCLISAFLGFVAGSTYIFAFLGLLLKCRVVVWLVLFKLALVYFFNSLILLQKAYLVLYRKKWIIYISIPFMLMQLGFGVFSIYFSYVKLEAEADCTLHYCIYLIYYWLVISIPLNVFFSVIFSRVAFQQYSVYGSDAWKRLARDGIQAMCLAVFCNLFFCALLMFQIGKSRSDNCFVLDLVIVTTILVNHCQNMRKVSRISNRPKTSYIPGYSQIDTENSKQ